MEQVLQVSWEQTVLIIPCILRLLVVSKLIRLCVCVCVCVTAGRASWSCFRTSVQRTPALCCSPSSPNTSCCCTRSGPTSSPPSARRSSLWDYSTHTHTHADGIIMVWIITHCVRVPLRWASRCAGSVPTSLCVRCRWPTCCWLRCRSSWASTPATSTCTTPPPTWCVSTWTPTPSFSESVICIYISMIQYSSLNILLINLNWDFSGSTRIYPSLHWTSCSVDYQCYRASHV